MIIPCTSISHKNAMMNSSNILLHQNVLECCAIGNFLQFKSFGRVIPKYDVREIMNSVRIFTLLFLFDFLFRQNKHMHSNVIFIVKLGGV